MKTPNCPKCGGASDDLNQRTGNLADLDWFVCCVCNHVFEHTACSRCGSTKDVEVRYSFGVYAGLLCPSCCRSYRDHCGIDQEQGDPSDLDEPVFDEDS